jgi:hypothetical protein
MRIWIICTAEVELIKTLSLARCFTLELSKLGPAGSADRFSEKQVDYRKSAVTLFHQPAAERPRHDATCSKFKVAGTYPNLTDQTKRQISIKILYRALWGYDGTSTSILVEIVVMLQ